MYNQVGVGVRREKEYAWYHGVNGGNYTGWGSVCTHEMRGMCRRSIAPARMLRVSPEALGRRRYTLLSSVYGFRIYTYTYICKIIGNIRSENFYGNISIHFRKYQGFTSLLKILRTMKGVIESPETLKIISLYTFLNRFN